MTYLVWGMWLVAMALGAVVAVQTLRSRSGESPVPRLGAALGVAVLSTALAVSVAGLPSLPGTSTGNADVIQLRSVRSRIQALSGQLQVERAREAQLAKIVGPAAAAVPGQEQGTSPAATGSGSGASGAADALEPQAPPSRGLLGVALLALLAINAAGVALLAGPRLAAWLPWLFLNGKDHAVQLERLEELAELVWAKDYAGARAKADEIKELQLRKSEMADLYFLRSYAAVQIAAFDTGPERAVLLDAAIRDLGEIVQISAKRGEAFYLLGLAHGLREAEDTEAIDNFAVARNLLADNLTAIDHNESVCQLRLAETSLSVGDTVAANACFDRVAALGTLDGSILEVRLKTALFEVRAAMTRQAIGDATSLLQRVLGFAGLSAEQKESVEVLGIELAARNALLASDPATAVREVEGFVARHLAGALPPLDLDLVEETFSPLLDQDLAFPREIYRSILFVGAVASCTIAARQGGTLTEAQVDRLAEPLLRALQLQPRHRDLLAAIGGLFYWTRPELRARARTWLESAVTMGVDSRFAHLILERDRAVAAERVGVMDLFRSSSAQFLRDPTIQTDLRKALVDQLGRFQEFEPMLLELQAKPELAWEEPTVSLLRDRSRYLAELIENSLRRGDPARHHRLTALRAQYVIALETLESSAQSLETLGKSAIAELGDSLVAT